MFDEDADDFRSWLEDGYVHPDEQRAGIADLLAGLTDAEWQRPSPCADWTVRQVAAHLTQQELGVADLFTLMRAWRGSFDRTTRTMARRQAAALSPAQIVAGIRARWVRAATIPASPTWRRSPTS